MTPEAIMLVGMGTGLVLIGVVVQLWNCAYEIGELKERVKQNEAEIKQLKKAMRDGD